MNPYPEHTPPAPPEGMKWEYRGMGWRWKLPCVHYFIKNDGGASVPGQETPQGMNHHYFEAVPIIGNTYHGSNIHRALNERTAKMNAALTENPKESAGRKKCPMHLLSPSAMRETANALGHGATKYKARNYRTAGVNATTYVGAILRHLSAWNDGEDLDPESGLSHIAHVAACADILLDTMACGMMNDDRSKRP